MADWVQQLARCIAGAERAVLVTVAHAAGSTPRDAGTAMIVTATGSSGTIGGGHLEFEAMRIARDALGNNLLPLPWVVRFPLAARLGQCCGGVATLAFSAVDARASAWIDKTQACMRAELPFAVVWRIGGTADRDAVRMLVTLDDATGTLGAPVLDTRAVALARERLQQGSAGAGIVDVADMETALLCHVVLPESFPILVFGNGHVGRALVQVLSALPARIRWIDSRDDEFPHAVPANVEIVATDAPDDELRHAPKGAYIVVMTHSHALDYDLVEAALRRDDWRYVGLIGSRSKRNQFEKRLAARGVTAAQLARVVCPIGASNAPGLSSKEPGVIAVAVAAELLAVRAKSSSGHVPFRLSSHSRVGMPRV
jgi:xanthine dehydrogenase accessory factor